MIQIGNDALQVILVVLCNFCCCFVFFILLALQVNSFKRASIVNLPNKVFMARISSLCHAVK